MSDVVQGFSYQFHEKMTAQQGDARRRLLGFVCEGARELNVMWPI